MKKRFYIALALGIAVLCLCQCRRVPFCFNVPQDFWNDYFPYQEGQTVTFQNEYGETKTFVVEDAYVNFGIYEPYTDDTNPDPHCGSCASVGLSDGDDAVRMYFSMHDDSYKKEKYGFVYTLRFDFPQDALPGTEDEWWKKTQEFGNQQYGNIRSLYKLFGETVEFEKESYGGESPDNIYDVKCEKGKGLSEFSEKTKGCTWRLVE